MTRRKSHQRGSLAWHNNCWTVRYWERNHQTSEWKLRRTKLDGFDDPNKKKAACKAADDFIAKVKERNNNPKPSKPQEPTSDITFKEFVDTRWKAYTVEKKHQITTLDLRDSLMQNHLLPVFGELKLRDIKPTHIADFFEAKQEKYSDSTRMAMYKLLRLLFDIARQYDLIKKSPVRPKRHRPDLGKITKPTLSAAQIRQVIGNLEEEQERLFVLLLSVTGMRVREAMALRWIDFDSQACMVTVNHSLYRGKLKKPKTEASADRLNLHPSMAGLLAAHKVRSAFRADKDFIFCRLDGQALTYGLCLEHLHKAIEDAGIERERGKHGFHILRHSAGTLLYARSRDLKLVQGTLRHSDISTTSDIYIHLSNEVLSEGSKVLTEEILSNCDLFVTQKSERAS